MEKRYFWNCFDHSLYPNLTGRCQKIGNIELQTNSYLLIDLIFWKLAYLISQLRTEFRKKLFWLKTCPKGVLLGFLIFTTSVYGCLCEKWPLKSKSMSPTLTPTEFSTLTYYHQFAHRLEIHLYSDKTLDTWDSNRHEFAKTWHFKHTDPEKFYIACFTLEKIYTASFYGTMGWFLVWTCTLKHPNNSFTDSSLVLLIHHLDWIFYLYWRGHKVEIYLQI